MAEGGFDPNDPNSFEMNKDTQDDDPSEDLSTIDITQNDPGFSGGSQQETSFITTEASQASRWIKSFKDSLSQSMG